MCIMVRYKMLMTDLLHVTVDGSFLWDSYDDARVRHVID